MFGTMSDNNKLAAGLNVFAIHVTYHIKSYIGNVTAYGNTGKFYGNIFIRIHCKVILQVTQVNCTGGHEHGLVLKLEGDSSNCKSQAITQSYFGENTVGALLHLDPLAYHPYIRLENVTVVNHIKEALQAHLNPNTILIIENINISHNMGPVQISSSGLEYPIIKFHGSSTFAHNNSTHQALHLSKCTVTFHGNTTFLQNKGRYGGAICAVNSAVNFYGSVIFLKKQRRIWWGILFTEC